MGRPVDDNLIKDGANNLQPLELTVLGEDPDEIHDAKIVDRFETPSSESFLLDIGAFDDGMRKYMMAEKFEADDWKWCNTFPVMDALQLAGYLEGVAKNCDEPEEYKSGLRIIAGKLRKELTVLP